MTAPTVMPDPRRIRWALLILSLWCFLLLMNAGLVMGRASGIWDADDQFCPYYTLIADHARAGKFLLWNPWTNGGSPDCCEPQIGCFSPVTFALGALTGGREWGFRLYWLLMWGLGGVGVVLLGRYLGAPPWGAAVVALGFLFSGIYTGQAEHTSHLVSISAIPFIIWRLDVALTSRRVLPALEAGAIYGLSALAGYPGLTVLTGGYAVLWGVGRWVSGRGATGAQADPSQGPAPAGSRNGPRLQHVLLTLGVAIGVALLVVSPTYVGFFAEVGGYSDRAGPLPRRFASEHNALHPGALGTFASPYLARYKQRHAGLWPYTDVSMISIYAGPLIPCLALVALLGRRDGRWRGWLAAMGLLYLGCALGRVLPLRAWLYDIVPATRFFRHSAIFRDYFVLTEVVLALMAVSDLAAGDQDRRKVRRRLLLVSAALAGAATVSYAVILGRDLYFRDDRELASAHMHFGIVWLGVVALAGGAYRYGGTFTRARMPALLVMLAVVDAGLAGVISRPLMYGQADKWRSIDAHRSASLDLSAGGLARQEVARYGANRNLPLKIPVLQGYSTFRSDFHSKWIGEPVLRAAATGEERIWYSAHAAEVAPRQSCFQAFVERTRDLGRPPLVVHSRAAMLTTDRDEVVESEAAEDCRAIAHLPPATRAQVDLRAYRPNELRFVVDCPKEGWLLVTDRWARGWRVTVNGAAAPVWGGDFIFRAVRVKGGENEVRFTYRPLGYPWLLGLSWSVLVSVLLASLWAGRGGRAGLGRGK